MQSPFSEFLEAKGVVLADGGMGTGLMAQGLKRGVAPEVWNVENAEGVRAVHAGFIEAGADVVLTNSFGGNRVMMERHGHGDRVAELNEAAARLAREAADGAGRRVLVAGSMGPTGQLLKPLGKLTAEEAEEAFTEQAAALAEGGVDLIWIETESAPEEMAAAMKGAAKTGLPFTVTLSFDTKGRTMMGTTPAAAREAALAADPALAGFGANCGNGPAQMLETLLQLAEVAEDDELIIAKSNCGVPRLGPDGIQYDGTPEIMADYARLARDAGARVIGGCCGTSAQHLAAMAKALDGYEKGPLPDADTVKARLGA